MRHGLALCLVALGLPPLAGTAHAAWFALSQGVPGSVVQPGFAVSPDGRRAVYVQDATLDGSLDLRSVPVAGGAPVLLASPIEIGEGWIFLVSPDSQRVVYVSEQETADVLELWSVPIGGGAAVKLNPTLVAGGDVGFFMIAPGGARVVYYADQQVDERFDLWSVPIAGGAAVKLNPTLVAGGAVSEFRIAPDGARVVYAADQQTLGVRELWSVPITGGAATRLNPAMVAGGDVSFLFLISPNGARVVYLADQQTDDVDEIWSVPIGGGAATKLNPALVAGGDVLGVNGLLAVSPDSSRVVYLADQESDEVAELFSVPLAGGAATKLNPPLVAGGDVDVTHGRVAISPDSARVVYPADQLVDDVVELFSVPIAGGAAVKLNPALVDFGDVEDFRVGGPAGALRAVYAARQDSASTVELYSAPIGGGVAVKLSLPLVAGGNVGQFEIGPDGAHVVYRADQQADERFAIRSAPIAGGPVRLLSGALTAGGDVTHFAIAANGRDVVYRADQQVDEEFALYVGDRCLLCSGFEAGDTQRWSATVPQRPGFPSFGSIPFRCSETKGIRP